MSWTVIAVEKQITLLQEWFPFIGAWCEMDAGGVESWNLLGPCRHHHHSCMCPTMHAKQEVAEPPAEDEEDVAEPEQVEAGWVGGVG